MHPKQPYFYFVNRQCVNFHGTTPFTMKHKMVIGPWEDRRSLIECVYGFHDYCTYNPHRQDIQFEKKNGGHRGYIIGYTWNNFQKHRGDVKTCPTIKDDEIISVGDTVIVSCKALPVWAPRYLPKTRRGMIANFEKTIGRDYRLWEKDYIPKGMTKYSGWKRKHFSNFTISDIETCKKAWSRLPESKLVPGIPFNRDFRVFFARRKKKEERQADVLVGIPKTLTGTIDTEARKTNEQRIREDYIAACKPTGVCVRCYDEQLNINKTQFWKRINVVDVCPNKCLSNADDPYESLFRDYECGVYCPNVIPESANTCTRKVVTSTKTIINSNVHNFIKSTKTQPIVTISPKVAMLKSYTRTPQTSNVNKKRKHSRDNSKKKKRMTC